MYNREYGFKYIPGNGGKDCPGDGRHKDAFGNLIECCCDECDYYICCAYGGCCDSCREFDCEYNKKEL